MDEGLATTARYWCHACSRVIVPVMELEVKCPYCRDGFVEVMGSTGNDQGTDEEFESDRDRALSLWAPVLLGMMGNHHSRQHTIRRLGFYEEEEELENMDPDRYGNQERQRVVLINPFRQTIVIQGSSNQSSETSNLIGSFGDYFIGPGLDLLLQHLFENDSNRYGTPPAQKETVEAMPIVKIDEKVQCSVCLDDLEVGTEAREMPCKHMFHEACILPWLALHSSCPVCRFQLPTEEVKNDSERLRDVNGSGEREREGDDSGIASASEEPDENLRNESRSRFQFPWPFNSLFSSSSDSEANTAGNSTASSSLSLSSSNAREGVS